MERVAKRSRVVMCDPIVRDQKEDVKLPNEERKTKLTKNEKRLLMAVQKYISKKNVDCVDECDFIWGISSHSADNVYEFATEFGVRVEFAQAAIDRPLAAFNLGKAYFWNRSADALEQTDEYQQYKATHITTKQAFMTPSDCIHFFSMC